MPKLGPDHGPSSVPSYLRELSRSGVNEAVTMAASGILDGIRRGTERLNQLARGGPLEQSFIDLNNEGKRLNSDPFYRAVMAEYVRVLPSLGAVDPESRLNAVRFNDGLRDFLTRYGDNQTFIEVVNQMSGISDVSQRASYLNQQLSTEGPFTQAIMAHDLSVWLREHRKEKLRRPIHGLGGHARAHAATHALLHALRLGGGPSTLALSFGAPILFSKVMKEPKPGTPDGEALRTAGMYINYLLGTPPYPDQADQDEAQMINSDSAFRKGYVYNILGQLSQ